MWKIFPPKISKFLNFRRDKRMGCLVAWLVPTYLPTTISLLKFFNFVQKVTKNWKYLFVDSARLSEARHQQQKNCQNFDFGFRHRTAMMMMPLLKNDNNTFHTHYDWHKQTHANSLSISLCTLPMSYLVGLILFFYLAWRNLLFCAIRLQPFHFLYKWFRCNLPFKLLFSYPMGKMLQRCSVRFVNRYVSGRKSFILRGLMWTYVITHQYPSFWHILVK